MVVVDSSPLDTPNEGARDIRVQIDLPERYQRMLTPILRQHAPHAEIWAYGSRVAGGSHAASDLDLVIRQPPDLGQRFPALNELRDAIRESNIPIKVDVMDWAVIPKHFHEQILRCHWVWPKADDNQRETL